MRFCGYIQDGFHTGFRRQAVSAEIDPVIVSVCTAHCDQAPDILRIETVKRSEKTDHFVFNLQGAVVFRDIVRIPRIIQHGVTDLVFREPFIKSVQADVFVSGITEGVVMDGTGTFRHILQERIGSRVECGFRHSVQRKRKNKNHNANQDHSGFSHSDALLLLYISVSFGKHRVIPLRPADPGRLIRSIFQGQQSGEARSLPSGTPSG